MDYSLLTGIPLFRGVAAEELEELFTALKIASVRFRKNDILAMQDEPVNRLIILLRGSVKGEMTDPSGKLMKVEDIQAPSPLAILFLFGQQSRFPVQATAREEVEAVVIPRQAVLKMLSMNETVLRNFLDISADFASRLSRKLHFMSFRTIRQKMAVYLLELSRDSDSDTVELDKSKTALAEYFGISRPSLEREITLMQHDGLIDAQRRRIIITDKQRLVRLTAT
ncbi:Crp/Fnr family transcriptional regulator [uncultured Alistipes sp.]|uniref:Crp/Fnr family transcriptional regulator n=1 Tax=uncultured Alistipes sp. TaxID=538949 RepID=UPI0025ECA231|nr:Crp/Fnr family transcriptional regulator [uncultured Alistipes sp.]